MKNKKKNNYEENPFITIPASLGGISLATIILFLIFAKDNLTNLIPIIWGFVVLGIVAIFFAYKSKQKKKR